MTNKQPHRTRINRVVICRRGKKGTYTADYHHQGKHCRKSLGTTNLREARRRAVKLEVELDGRQRDNATERVEPKNRRQVALRLTIAEYITHLQTESRRRRTVVKYRGILQRFADFAEVHEVECLDDVDLVLIDKYRASRKPLIGKKQMYHESSLLKRFLNWCCERDLITSNSLATQRFRPPKSFPRSGPTLVQINDILKAATAVRYPVIATIAFTGLRSGDVASLRVEDVDLDGGWIYVASREGYESKTGSRWKLPIHSRLGEILGELPRRKSGWFFTALPSKKFPAGDHQIDTGDLNDDFKKYLRRLDIPAGQQKEGFTIHSLRRSFKTICINAGIPKEVVDIWQGHAPDRAASHLYYHLSDEESQRFMKMAPFGDEK